jgi:hypothetical protein
MRHYAATDSIPRFVFAPVSRRERRRIARAHALGRRGARRVEHATWCLSAIFTVRP